MRAFLYNYARNSYSSEKFRSSDFIPQRYYDHRVTAESIDDRIEMWFQLITMNACSPAEIQSFRMGWENRKGFDDTYEEIGAGEPNKEGSMQNTRAYNIIADKMASIVQVWRRDWQWAVVQRTRELFQASN